MSVAGQSTVWETSAVLDADGVPSAVETRAVAVELAIAHDPTCCGGHAS